MEPLAIHVFPDPILRAPNKEVTVFDDDLRLLIDHMVVLMKEADGVGLAAPQAGINQMIAVVFYDDRLYKLVNPEIVAQSGAQMEEEGCLSFPGIYGQVKRPMKLTVNCQDEWGQKHVYEAQGFLARAFAHEIDHLNGRLLIDHFSQLKREMLIKRLTKQR